ncbi:hypothetical protein LJC74_08810 [Eubacteriales bacterium OttesenSCG-928-A19]|nr:hypothetical protein [Eubacteriales bacterium OttesenSCG-928-A19]
MTGKSWFDKQSGPYRLTEADTHWEWFSLSFFDDQETMLFSYPQNDYCDSTYVTKNAAYRLNNYTLTHDRLIEVDGLKLASSWTLVAPGIREESAGLSPSSKIGITVCTLSCLQCDQLEVKKAGCAFVELLPGM